MKKKEFTLHHLQNNRIFKIRGMRNGAGFILIELVVAVALFSLAITIALSLFMAGIKGQRRIIANQNIQESARYILEFVAKEIRMSEITGATSSTLNLKRANGEIVSYSFDGSNINRTDSLTSGPINSSDVSIIGSFSVVGLGEGDGIQPKVTMAMKIQNISLKVEEQSNLEIQITVSIRNLEL